LSKTHVVDSSWLAVRQSSVSAFWQSLDSPWETAKKSTLTCQIGNSSHFVGPNKIRNGVRSALPKPPASFIRYKPTGILTFDKCMGVAFFSPVHVSSPWKLFYWTKFERIVMTTALSGKNTRSSGVFHKLVAFHTTQCFRACYITRVCFQFGYLLAMLPSGYHLVWAPSVTENSVGQWFFYRLFYSHASTRTYTDVKLK